MNVEVRQSPGIPVHMASLQYAINPFSSQDMVDTHHLPNVARSSRVYGSSGKSKLNTNFGEFGEEVTFEAWQ